MRPIVTVLIPLLVVAMVVSAGAAGQNDGSASAFAAAVKAAQEDPSAAFALQVSCLGDRGLRQFRLYPSGAAFWNEEAQVPVTVETRRALLRGLLDAGFAAFEPHYGGGDEEEEFDGPIRVSCQVDATVAGQRRQSIQERDGEQYAPLLTLANVLLDRIEALVPAGVKVTGLEDGLAKLSTGKLAEEALGLRYLYLPEKEASVGLLLQLEGGQLTSRRYRPGVELQPAAPRPLTPEVLAKVLDALRSAQFWALPVNVQADDHYQVYLNVLKFRHAVMARPFGRKPTDEQLVAENAVAELVATLKQIGKNANPELDP